MVHVDVLRSKYGDRLNKCHQQVVDACNQKRRDAKRRLDAQLQQKLEKGNSS